MKGITKEKLKNVAIHTQKIKWHKSIETEINGSETYDKQNNIILFK